MFNSVLFFRLCQYVKERLSRAEKESLFSLSRGDGVLGCNQRTICFSLRNPQRAFPYRLNLFGFATSEAATVAPSAYGDTANGESLFHMHFDDLHPGRGILFHCLFLFVYILIGVSFLLLSIMHEARRTKLSVSSVRRASRPLAGCYVFSVRSWSDCCCPYSMPSLGLQI